MRKIAIFLFGTLAFAAAGIQSAAADGCGRGLHYNGYRCVPCGQYYAGPRYYGERRYYRQPGYAYGGYRNQHSPSCGNPGFTVQDGVCKPYRGP